MRILHVIIQWQMTENNDLLPRANNFTPSLRASIKRATLAWSICKECFEDKFTFITDWGNVKCSSKSDQLKWSFLNCCREDVSQLTPACVKRALRNVMAICIQRFKPHEMGLSDCLALHKSLENYCTIRGIVTLIYHKMFWEVFEQWWLVYRH